MKTSCGKQVCIVVNRRRGSADKEPGKGQLGVNTQNQPFAKYEGFDEAPHRKHGKNEMSVTPLSPSKPVT